MTAVDSVTCASGVPYYCQWESPQLVAQFVDGSLRVADDPAWAASGASTPQEYEFWATRACGLACLKMILAWRGQPVPSTMHLVGHAVACKAYIQNDTSVTGLIYRPFAAWVRSDYGITAEVRPDLTLDELASAAAPGTPVIASVHSSIRWPERRPPERGGHLVLVTGAGDGLLRLHNPSGLHGVSQRDTVITEVDFARFFGGRGMLITG